MWCSKYTGCFPTSVPISDLSFNKGSAPDSKCSIPFRYFMYEPLSYAALIDFNFNSLGYRYMRKNDNTFRKNALSLSDLKFADSYNTNQSNPSSYSFLGSNFVGRPAIYLNPNTHVLSLKWVANDY